MTEILCCFGPIPNPSINNLFCVAYLSIWNFYFLFLILYVRDDVDDMTECCLLASNGFIV